MRRSHLRIAALAATLLAGAGCDAARPTAAKGGGDGGAGGVAVGPTDPTPIDVASCTRCHGDPSNGNAAPPMSVRGETATTAMGVGAHQAHLSTTKLRAPLRCDDCHQVPRTVSEQGHMGGPWATVKFDAERSDRLALTGGASPQYVRAADGTSGTCSNVYCHGATLGAGGRNTTPEWTLVDGSQKQCDSCHGAPPTKAGHPAVASDVTKCAGCHPATVDASGKILANGAHMDGKVDAAGGHPAGWSDPSQHGAAANAGGLGSCQTCHGVDLTGGSVGVSCDQCHSSGTPAWRTNCTFCHGDSTRFANPAAPPKGAAGQTATTDRSVGAHQSHLVAGPLAGAIACSECHLVPTNVLDASGQHVDGKREITFGTLARTASAAASFDATGATCATYCHGATLAGGSQKTPAWTGTFAPGQTTLSCTSCHGAPPPTASGVHAKVTQVTQCATCHAATVDATGAVLVAGGKHVNGAVDRANYHPAGWFVAGSGGAHPAAANTAQGAAACVTCHGDVSGTGGYVPVACADCHKAGGTANDFGTAAAASCTGCHGNAALTATPASPLNAAPPRATAGNTRPVGAHQAHLGNTNLRASPIACTECHAVPQSSLHATGAVDLTWGPLAAKAGTPSFNATTLTCATYCHGSPLAAGGSNTAPKWTDTAATATTCGTCHALPPPAPHPTVGATTNCSSCHTGYSGTPGGTTWVVNKAVHMDGKVDAAGAHDQSLAFTQPQNHGLMALDPVVTGGRGPQYCAGCHLGYGSAGTPTASGVTTSDCNACHAANGHASWVNECTFCHGGQDNQTGAPARDHTAVKIANGGASQPTTLVTVGAHTSHVGPTRLGGAALACADCHTVPSGADATVFPGHIDGTPGVTFATGSTARAGGAAPVWSAAAGGSCSATYCHGSTLNASTTRGPTTAPVWTTVNGSQETCGSCHKAPPTTPNHHNAAAVTTCSKCHGGTVQASGALVAGTALHVNGAVDYQGLTCVTCHGNPGNPAPAAGQDAFAAAAPTGGTALDTFGNTVTTQKGVGAHSAHVLGGRSRAVACSECHSGAVPATPTTQASYVHASGTTTVAFGTLARTGAVTPAYAGSGGSCSASYCHGNFAGGASAAPAWTGTFTATPSLGCTSCHGAPPALGTGVFHPPNPNCGSCHTGYTGSTVAAATHVDGTVNVATSGCTSCHGDLSVANVASGDVRAAPAGDASAVDAHGNAATATTSRGVGAHAKHLTSTAFRSAAIACSECHVVPATGDKTHANGTAAITFGTLARTAWAGQPAITPAYNTTSAGCAATYCHGNFKNGANATPVWTVAGTLNCTSCHGAPPAGTHPANATACGNCHDAAYSFNGTTGTVNAAQHMNGAVDLPNMSCTSCHGTTGRGGGTGATGTNPVAAAPPSGTKGETATTQAAVGAHLSHLANTVLRSAPIGCSECHAVPTSTSHATGAVDFAFGPLAKTGGAAPAFNATTNTCSNVYCHGTFTGGANASPSWVGTFAQGATTLGCTSCHGNPPAASTGHVQRDDCGSCHTGYAKTGATTGTVNLANHVNGTVDVVTLACTTCHGTQARANGAGGAAIAGVTYDANQAAAPPLDAQGANTGVLVGVHQAHANPQAAGATYKPLACTECHPNNTSTGHANGTVNLTFAAATGANLGGVTPAFVQGNGTSTATTCTVYCHGSSLSATTTKGARASWAWNGAAAACGDCHLAPPSTANHHNAAAVTTCAKCHGGTVDATGAVLVSGGKHINGTVDTQGLTCTSCHGGTAPPAATGQDANVAAAPTGTGAPDTFGNTGASSAGVGVHVAHVGGARSKPVLCNACHVVPTTPVHKTGAATAGTVTFGNLATTGSIATASYASAGAKTCSNTYCHGNFTGSGLTGAALTTVAWTAAGTLGCNACHGTGTGAAANPPPLPHPQNTSCGTCHGGYTNTTVNQATHVNGVVDQTGTGCTQCHGTPGRTTYAAEAPPIDSHGNTATTSRGVGAHATHLSAGGLSNAIACTECHVVPATGDKAHANGTPLITFGTLAKTGGVTPAFNTTAVSCASVYCHGNFSNGTTANAPVWTGTNQAACGTCHGIPPGGSHPALSAGTNCSGCHTGYNATPGSTNGTVNLANHVNGKVDVTGGGESAGGTNCGGCHGTIFNMMLASGGKTTRHTITTDVPTDTGGSWTGNLKTAAPYSAASCVNMCHGDHPHAVTPGGTHENNVYNDANARSTTSSTTTRSKTDFDAAQTNGGLCTSCHANAVDANHPAVSKAMFSGTAHDYASNTVGTATYAWSYTLHDNGVFARNCTKCHASPTEGQTPGASANGSGTVGPHASDFGSLLAGQTNPGATPASLVCFNCHGNGTVGKNMSGNDIATQAAKAQGHGQLIQSSTVHSTSTEDATTWNSGRYSGANRHVNCLDCHDTHQAGKTNHTIGPNDGNITASSPLNGVSGVKFSATLPAVFGTTAAANLQVVSPATVEYQVCFKCHTSWAFGATPPTGDSGMAETDLAQEFNPNNKSAHPVVVTLNNLTGSTAPKALATAQLLAPWNTSVGAQTMTCTDCHNTDAAAPAAQGPHGSAIKFMLRGTNKAWPYTTAAGNGGTTGTLFKLSNSETGLGTDNGLFCRNCHPQPNSAGSNSLHRNSNLNGGQHGGNANIPACANCHIRVPHGGKISRLWVTTNAPARYRTGTPDFAQMTKNASKDGYSTSSFPSGFKSSCSEHSSGTGSEAW